MIVYGANRPRGHPLASEARAVRCDAREHSGRMQKVVGNERSSAALRILSVNEVNRLAGKGACTTASSRK
jgi:hypothetical protein